ncbi:MAG: hypothetical protein LDL50_00960 [Chloroflexi bacterium]|nr:hypothetical protein [Chloroflexota bacterium]MCA2002305.1 hypothetical protein [Chloroflexota bacterium]
MSKDPEKSPRPKRRHKTSPQKIRLGRFLFVLNAFLWLGYGVYLYYDMAALNGNTTSADIVVLFVLLNAAMLFLSGARLGASAQWSYFLAVAVPLFNALLSLFNIEDLFFLASFSLDLLILWLVVPLRRQYFPKS